MNNFYVYIYKDPIIFEPFYVGKGCNGRYRDISARKYNKHLYNKIQKYRRQGYFIKDITFFEQKNLFERDALSLEIELIRKIGRRDLGTGPLLNLTDGGDGVIGAKKKLPTLLPYADKIKKMYLVEGMSMKEIGEEFNCSFTPVWLLLKYLNINCKKRPDITDQIILDEYKNGLSMNQIAQKYAFDNGSIKKCLIKYKVKIRPQKAYASRLGPKSKFTNLQEQQIIQDYRNGMSRPVISKKWLCDVSVINRILNTNNILLRDDRYAK